MKKKYSLGMFYITIVYLLILQYILQENIEIFKYFDEFLACLFFPTVIIYAIKNHGKIRIKRKNIIISICIVSVILIGLLSNLIHGYQYIKYILSDLIVFMKFFLVYFLFEILFKNKLTEYNKLISFNIKFITVILFILSILNYIFKFFPIKSERFGIGANQLCFGHPTALAAVVIMLMGNLLFFRSVNSKSFYITIIMQIILIMSTLRMKAIAFAIVSILLMIYILKFNKKIKIINIILLGTICFLIGYNQIIYYFTTDGSARGELFSTSLKIANDYFPLGTGFATFGSYYSGVNYSPIYNMYGIDNVWGITESNPLFISDTFWPMILGQFGYIGTALYGICIIMIFLKIQEEYSTENKYKYLAKILCLVYLLISSTSENAFAHPIAIPLAILLAI